MKAFLNSQLKPIYKEAARILGLTAARHDVSPDAPADLRDTSPNWDYTPDGSPVSALLLPQDFERGLDRPMQGLAVAVIAMVILLVSGVVSGVVSLADGNALHGFLISAALLSVLSIVIFGVDGFFAGVAAVLMSPPFALFGAVAALFYKTSPKGDAIEGISREEMLFKQAASDSASASYVSDWQDVQRIKLQQCETAAKDKTPFIALGRSSGHFRRHGDPFSPDASKDFGYTASDMNYHTAIMGKTGTGKTVVIKKVVKQLCDHSDAGMLALCGKGTLPRALERMLANQGYTLLNPENSKLALFQGMTAMEVVDALAVRSEKEDAFFYGSARALLKNAAVLLKALADAKVDGYKFTPRNLLTMINSNGGVTESADGKSYTKHGSYRESAIQHAIKLEGADGVKLVDVGGMLTAAFDFFEAEFQQTQKSEKTLAGVMMHVNMWLEPLFTHELIAQWANCDEGVDVTECLTGKRIGLDVPATIYGQAAASIVVNLVRQRLYSALKKRGDEWFKVEGQKAVLLLIDEMHLVWQAESGDGMDDNSMVSIARSLGGMFVVGTQSVDEMESRFGEEKTLASLGNFRNFLCYEATEKTLEYVSARVGATLRPVGSIHNEDGEVQGVNLRSSLGVEQMVPRNFGGRLGGDAAAFAKRMAAVPVDFVVGALSKSYSNRLAIGNNARATYAVATVDELGIMLTERFAAIAVLYRAGAPRRDVIIINPDD